MHCLKKTPQIFIRIFIFIFHIFFYFEKGQPFTWTFDYAGLRWFHSQLFLSLMLQFVHGINKILHLPFSYSVCIVFRDCLVLRKCYLLRFQANASRGCQRRGWHVPHPWFCSATDKPLDVSLLEGRASCCAGGQTARQCKVHFGVCWASGTQSLGSCVSQHRGLKCVHGGYTISFCLNCWKSSFMLFSQCSPSKAECVMLFGLNMLVCYW